MAKKPHRSAGNGVIANAKGDRGAYLGHYRSARVMKHGHNQGAPSALNVNPISNPTPGEPGVATTPAPRMSTTMPVNKPIRAATEQPVVAVRAPRQTAGVPRTSRDAGMAGRPKLANDAGMAPRAPQQPANPRVAATQRALESLRQSIGKVRASRQSARSILGGMNVNKGRGRQ